MCIRDSSETDAYSAYAPTHQPKTSSPGRNRVTLVPTASTCPATSVPRTAFFGLRSPYTGRATYGRPLMIAQSAGLTPAARTRTNTWSSAISGLLISLSSRTSAEPYVLNHCLHQLGSTPTVRCKVNLATIQRKVRKHQPSMNFHLGQRGRK